MPYQQDLDALFQRCNQHFFNGEIQPSLGFKLRLSRSRKLFGCFTFCLDTHTDWSISMADWLMDHPLAALNTMTHEMLHMLAHQRFRETRKRFYLDLHALPGHPFINKGHGAFFLTEMARLNRCFTELQLSVKSVVGGTLFNHNKIPPARLLLVTIDQHHGWGMIYRLHENAPLDWRALRATAQHLHGQTPNVKKIKLIKVPGHYAEGFPVLKKNNQARINMVPMGLKRYAEKALALLKDPRTAVLNEFDVGA